jgi:hypothetical protein
MIYGCGSGRIDATVYGATCWNELFRLASSGNIADYCLDAILLGTMRETLFLTVVIIVRDIKLVVAGGAST